MEIIIQLTSTIKNFDKKNNVRARRFLESFFTSYYPNAINGIIEFSEIYVPTIKKCID